MTPRVSFDINKNMRGREQQAWETKRETEAPVAGKEQVSSCAITYYPHLSLQYVLFWFFNR